MFMPNVSTRLLWLNGSLMTVVSVALTTTQLFRMAETGWSPLAVTSFLYGLGAGMFSVILPLTWAEVWRRRRAERRHPQPT